MFRSPQYTLAEDPFADESWTATTNFTAKYTRNLTEINTLLCSSNVNESTGVAELHRSNITGVGITIAIVDTGLDYYHRALGRGLGPEFKVTYGRDYSGEPSTRSEFSTRLLRRRRNARKGQIQAPAVEKRMMEFSTRPPRRRSSGFTTLFVGPSLWNCPIGEEGWVGGIGDREIRLCIDVVHQMCRCRGGTSSAQESISLPLLCNTSSFYYHLGFFILSLYPTTQIH